MTRIRERRYYISRSSRYPIQLKPNYHVANYNSPISALLLYFVNTFLSRYIDVYIVRSNQSLIILPLQESRGISRHAACRRDVRSVSQFRCCLDNVRSNKIFLVNVYVESRYLLGSLWLTMDWRALDHSSRLRLCGCLVREHIAGGHSEVMTAAS